MANSTNNKIAIDITWNQSPSSGVVVQELCVYQQNEPEPILKTQCEPSINQYSAELQEDTRYWVRLIAGSRSRWLDDIIWSTDAYIDFQTPKADDLIKGETPLPPSGLNWKVDKVILDPSGIYLNI